MRDATGCAQCVICGRDDYLGVDAWIRMISGALGALGTLGTALEIEIEH